MGKMFTDSLESGFPWSAIKRGVYRNSKALTFWLAISNALHRRLNTFDRISSFIVLGAHSKELFVDAYFKKYKDKFVVRPNFSPPKNNGAKLKPGYYLFIGRLTEEKGIYTLLETFSKTDFRLTIAGSGPMADQVLSASRKHGNINFLGQLDTEQLDKLLDHAEALIFPSEWFETFGMVIIEALSKSVPVIASNLGNIKFIVKNGRNGLTFEPGNPGDLLEKVKIYSCLRDNEKSSYQHQALASYQEKYTPKISYEAVMEIYSRAINRHFYHPSPFYAPSAR